MALKKGANVLLPGRLCALFDVRRQQWERVEILEGAKVNGKVHAQAMLQGLSQGGLLLFDRGYLRFAWFDALQEAELWWVSRYANKVSFQVLHTLYEGDGVLDAIVYLGIHRSDQARSPVRLVRFWAKGQPYGSLTNVLDAHQLSLHDIARV